MLQRVPVILAVTAGSYGLSLQEAPSQKRTGAFQGGGEAGRRPAASRRRRERATS